MDALSCDGGHEAVACVHGRVQRERVAEGAASTEEVMAVPVLSESGGSGALPAAPFSDALVLPRLLEVHVDAEGGADEERHSFSWYHDP